MLFFYKKQLIELLDLSKLCQKDIVWATFAILPTYFRIYCLFFDFVLILFVC
jgi:hypothetical protein